MILTMMNEPFMALADVAVANEVNINDVDNNNKDERVAAEARASNGPNAATSIIKYAAAAMAQERSELMVEAMGAQGLGWAGGDYSAAERQAVRGWLRSKGNSIEGGTSEINLNVVSKHVLGLPDPK